MVVHYVLSWFTYVHMVMKLHVWRQAVAKASGERAGRLHTTVESLPACLRLKLYPLTHVFDSYVALRQICAIFLRTCMALSGRRMKPSAPKSPVFGTRPSAQLVVGWPVAAV